ncbi:hypothetical protein EUX98_g8945 [Antrodiella citrinella]|uniref:Uncharacterized protein n=1 Tax=Antrodiella citrinella TaxID=2447956 RepID=A0A4S4M0F9_9APHY|nr:hypothetical protein EUX98_g8945 [Antrodiella citrinella]
MSSQNQPTAAAAPKGMKKMQQLVKSQFAAVIPGNRAPSERKSKTAILPGRKTTKPSKTDDERVKTAGVKDSLPASRKRATSNSDLKTTVKRAKVDTAEGNVGVVKSVRKHKNVAPEYEPVAKPKTHVDVKTWPPKRSANARKVAAAAAEISRCIVAPHNDDDVSTSDEQYAAQLAAELDKPSLPRQKAAARLAHDDDSEAADDDSEDDAEDELDDDQYELQSEAAMDEDEDDNDSVGSDEVPSWTSQLREDSTELPESFTAHLRPGPSPSQARNSNTAKLNAAGLFDSDRNVQTVKSYTKGPTAAQLKKRAMEEPVFDDADDIDSQAGGADNDDDDGDSIPEDDGERSGHGNDGNTRRSYRRKQGGGGDGGDGGGHAVDNNGHWWPAWTNLVLTPRGTANLLAQAPAIRRILDRAIRLVEEEFAFIKGYPEADG